MWTFLALVTAVVALVIAKRALNEVRELRASLDAHRQGAGGTAAEAAAPPTAAAAPAAAAAVAA